MQLKFFIIIFIIILIIFLQQHLSGSRPRPHRHGKTIDVFIDNSYLTLKDNKNLDLEIDISDFEQLLNCDKTKVSKTWPVSIDYQEDQ